MRADESLRIRRMSRISEIKQDLHKALKRGVEIAEKRYIAVKCLEWGSSERTVKEYVNLLVNSEYCRREDGTIFIKRSLKGGIRK